GLTVAERPKSLSSSSPILRSGVCARSAAGAPKHQQAAKTPTDASLRFRRSDPTAPFWGDLAEVLILEGDQTPDRASTRPPAPGRRPLAKRRSNPNDLRANCQQPQKWLCDLSGNTSHCMRRVGTGRKGGPL